MYVTRAFSVRAKKKRKGRLYESSLRGNYSSLSPHPGANGPDRLNLDQFVTKQFSTSLSALFAI